MNWKGFSVHCSHQLCGWSDNPNKSWLNMYLFDIGSFILGSIMLPSVLWHKQQTNILISSSSAHGMFQCDIFFRRPYIRRKFEFEARGKQLILRLFGLYQILWDCREFFRTSWDSRVCEASETFWGFLTNKSQKVSKSLMKSHKVWITSRSVVYPLIWSIFPEGFWIEYSITNQ